MSSTRLAAMRRFTIRFVNPITRRFVGHLPGFALVHTVGRKSGQPIQIPMNVFRDGEAYVMALTYGPDVHWVWNVVAAGGCELEIRGRRVRVAEPELIHDPARRLMPIPVRWFLGIMQVSDFLRLRPG